MRFLKYFLLNLLLLLALNLHSQLKSPDEFLSHKIGDEFTPHYMLVDYMHHVADNSANVIIKEYGKTNQKRPLLNLIVSDQKNIDNIDKIRLNNLFRAGLPDGQSFPEFDDITIVWLSFSVHGNEPSGSESSMPVLFELANKKNPNVSSWLKNTVVIIDPSINPDGYSRYTHWQRNVAEKEANSDPDDREHSEPWPGGRVNHYLFDLNRDWAWQTQIESQQRVKVYNQWLPQVHVDFHEMMHNDPYYFAPAAAPYHDYITKWQGEFQHLIGRNHAKYFDKEGWLYFTREVFDLFYPSYGDTYPIFNGAIGMTHEQGGHSRAGRAIEMENSEILTLKDRVAHHYTTALSAIETSSNNATKLIEEFKLFFKKPSLGKYKSYLIKGDNSYKIKDLADLLDKQSIKYIWTKDGASGNAYDYQKGEQGEYKIQKGDLLIPVNQPKSTLVQVLFDPETVLEDSLTYDITAWALPFAYGLQAFASTNVISAEPMTSVERGLTEESAPYYAIIIHWNSINSAKVVAQLHKKGVKMRLSSIPFEIESKKFSRNSIIITKADNRNIKDSLLQIAKECGVDEMNMMLVNTGFSDAGADLGSDKMGLITKPNVLLLSGEKTSSNSFGQVWHYFEQVIDYPLTIIDADRISSVKLEKYNVLIIPEGRLGLNENELKKIVDWTRGGGKLISIGYANQNFTGKEGFALKEFATDDEKNEAKKEQELMELSDRFHAYEGAARRGIVNNVPGSIFEVKMDITHPLAYGIDGKYFSLKTNGLSYRPLIGAFNVGVIPENGRTIGFTGSAIKKKLMGSVSFAAQNMGRGSVVYLIDNPLFRGFWKEGQLLFSNAVFLVN